MMSSLFVLTLCFSFSRANVIDQRLWRRTQLLQHHLVTLVSGMPIRFGLLEWLIQCHHEVRLW